MFTAGLMVILICVLAVISAVGGLKVGVSGFTQGDDLIILV